MIPQTTINRIIEVSDGDLLHIIQAVCPELQLTRQGLSHIACCPLHGEKTPSFYITPSKKMWKCFGCGKGGGALQFVMKKEGCSFIEAIRKVAGIENIPLISSSARKPVMQKVSPVSSMQFEYRPLSSSDLVHCGVPETTETDLYYFAAKLKLFALKSITYPPKKGTSFSWQIRESAEYPLLAFIYKNRNGTYWGTLYQPNAENEFCLRNFGTRSEGSVFFSDKIRDFALALRSGGIKRVDLNNFLD